MASAGPATPPRDVVAIFHASFHPTQGNIVDWSAKSPDVELSLDGVEFSVLPSGLHTIDQDVIYFVHQNYSGVCVFRRRRTTAEGQRGFRLASLGILLAHSVRPRPWRHVSALTELADEIYANAADEDMDTLDDGRWDNARAFFKEREASGGEPTWSGWQDELEDDTPTPLSPNADPALHLAYLLRLLGPSSLVLYKHVLGRQRILFYTAPPVERAGILCRAAADMCFQAQAAAPEAGRDGLKGRQRDGVPVLGMITLHDIDKLRMASEAGRGWVACTTDAIFLERPQYYDLVIDLTTFDSAKGTRPAFYQSRSQPGVGPRGPSHRLSAIRFSWSDVRLWNELDRLLQLDTDGEYRFHDCSSSTSTSTWSSAPPTAPQNRWADTWRMYEDVCLLCAGVWMGMRSRDWTGPGVRLEGVDELELDTAPRPKRPRNTVARRASSMVIRRSNSNKSSKSNTVAQGLDVQVQVQEGPPDPPPRATPSASSSSPSVDGEDWVELARRRELTARALLTALESNTRLLLSRLAIQLPPLEERPARVTLPLQALSALDLGPLSTLDARFACWLAQEYANGSTVIVRRGWRDVLGYVFGVGG